jgi:hypothetical protein
VALEPARFWRSSSIQFFSGAGEIFTTLTDKPRNVLFEGQLEDPSAPGHRLYPTRFCRECGHEVHVVTKTEDAEGVLLQDLRSLLLPVVRRYTARRPDSSIAISVSEYSRTMPTQTPPWNTGRSTPSRARRSASASSNHRNGRSRPDVCILTPHHPHPPAVGASLQGFNAPRSAV